MVGDWAAAKRDEGMIGHGWFPGQRLRRAGALWGLRACGANGDEL